MGVTLINTHSTLFRKARDVNATDTSFPSKIPTATEPTGSGSTATGASVIELSRLDAQASHVYNSALIVPYALGDDDDAFSMRVIGWRRIGTNSVTDLWIPVILGEYTCTVSTAVGIAGMEVLDTERFADTLTIVTGNSGISTEIVSPTGNVIAHILVDLKGFQKLELTFDMTTGNPTSANALIAFL